LIPDAASLYAATARAAARRAMVAGDTQAAARLLGSAAFVHDITRPDDDRALQILLRRQGITMDSPEGQEWGCGWWDGAADRDERVVRFRRLKLTERMVVALTATESERLVGVIETPTTPSPEARAAMARARQMGLIDGVITDYGDALRGLGDR
jgi:hypothetical protein